MEFKLRLRIILGKYLPRSELLLILSVFYTVLQALKKKKKNQDHIPCSFCYKLVCVDNKFSKPIVFYRVKNAAKFIKAILEEYNYCRKVMKNHFNKNSIMTEEDEETFQSSNECCGSEKRIDDQEKKVRDHCHITKKFRGAAHVNLKLAKNVFVVFHGLKGL